MAAKKEKAKPSPPVDTMTAAKEKVDGARKNLAARVEELKGLLK